MLKSTDIYIDLGTTNTLIYAKNRGFVLNEPSVIALKHSILGRNQFRAIGSDAKKMLGKNPLNLSVLRPLKEGVIADFDNTARMLHHFIQTLKDQMLMFKPRMIISLPCQVTNYEKQSVEEIGYSLGARKVHLLDEPVAAAIGAGLPVLSNQGSMVVDIGGGTTEIAIISMGGIISARAVRVGGTNIDEAIIELLNSKFRFAVGEQTAERIKIQIGSAVATKNSMVVSGLDLTSGLPKRFIVTSEMIYPAVNGVILQIIASIKHALERCPPEIAGDLAHKGIVLAGGGALIQGIAPRISQEIGIPVQIAHDPLLSVANGGARALDNSKLFDALERPA